MSDISTHGVFSGDTLLQSINGLGSSYQPVVLPDK